MSYTRTETVPGRERPHQERWQAFCQRLWDEYRTEVKEISLPEADVREWEEELRIGPIFANILTGIINPLTRNVVKVKAIPAPPPAPEDAYEAKIERLKAALRTAQWNGGLNSAPHCPWCGGLKTVGHYRDCELIAALVFEP